MKALIIGGPVVLVALALGIVTQVGCSSPQDAAAAEQSKYVLREEPQGAVDVLQARNDAKHDEEIVVVGRIGGSRNPWTDGVAAFSIVDRSLTPCNEMEGDTCRTPWDYCCEPELSKATLLVKFVDESGKIARTDARQLLKLEELQTVVVKGKALRDEAGNVSIAATGMHVRE